MTTSYPLLEDKELSASTDIVKIAPQDLTLSSPQMINLGDIEGKIYSYMGYSSKRVNQGDIINPSRYYIDMDGSLTSFNLYALVSKIDVGEQEWGKINKTLVNIRRSRTDIGDPVLYIKEKMEGVDHVALGVLEIESKVTDTTVDILILFAGASLLPRKGGQVMFCFLINYLKQKYPGYSINIKLLPINDIVKSIYIDQWGFRESDTNYLKSDLERAIHNCGEISSLYGNVFRYNVKE